MTWTPCCVQGLRALKDIYQGIETIRVTRCLTRPNSQPEKCGKGPAANSDSLYRDSTAAD